MDVNFEFLQEVNAEIENQCAQIKALLLDKNTEYGNAAIDPKRIFSRLAPLEQIDVRIDDKLSRINYMRDHHVKIKEDTVLDLVGYLILRRVAETIEERKQKAELVRNDLATPLRRKKSSTRKKSNHGWTKVKSSRRKKKSGR